ncbi:hypothetical protein XM53_02525 [Roseovarius atlanticus]|uniref:Uncharacterized protein n=1 Tax=Roseovarius atlanticus TaxID=1641875 RepID=A0A0T5P0D6_9RHOB|nr:hypothetical protein [Roseovarius atlanticus]KRS14600.1 hypothetical protein XM53_02525 [Roseovarius atlanticus]
MRFGRAPWFFIPLLALVCLGAVIALLLGGRSVTTTETAVIEAVADRYVAEAGAGAARSDCQATPAQSSGLWLVVTCEGAAARVEYFVDRFGKVTDRREVKKGA